MYAYNISTAMEDECILLSLGSLGYGRSAHIIPTGDMTKYLMDTKVYH